jgi:pimeloyl-ACP methyl ester carboxylesterase
MWSDLPPGFAHVRIPVNNILLHTIVGGQGPAVVLVHGWMGTSYSWRKVLPMLAAHCTLIVPDMRGYGDSSKPHAGYDGLTTVADLNALLAAMGKDKAFVIGHDMGAPVALLYALTHPEKTLGVGYFDEPLLGYNLDRFTAFSADNPFIYWWFAFNSTDHVAAFLWSGREAEMVDYMITSMVADPQSVDEAARVGYVRGLRAPGGLHGSFGWYRDSLKTSAQIKSALDRGMLGVPLLALNGEYGHLGVKEQFEGLVKTIEGATLPGVGHLIAEEAPEAVAMHIRNFVARFSGQLK